MVSSNPTGTGPPSAEAVRSVLEREFGDQAFTRDAAVTILTETPAEEYPDHVDTAVARRLANAQADAFHRYLDTLQENGYLYDVDGDLKVTP